MEDTELEDLLFAADLIVMDYNDPSNDNNGGFDILIEDGEGARPTGKNFVEIYIKDDYIMYQGQTDYFHHYYITFGIPSYFGPN